MRIKQETLLQGIGEGGYAIGGYKPKAANLLVMARAGGGDGDPSSKASDSALRRATARLGLSLYEYKRDGWVLSRLSVL